MPVLTVPEDIALIRSAALTPVENNRYQVVCYCARWCDTCRDYAPAFSALAEKWPQHVFVWVDIEENPELLGDEDVENFPTILVQSGEQNLFFGPLLPHISHLDKLLETAHRLNATDIGPPPLATLL